MDSTRQNSGNKFNKKNEFISGSGLIKLESLIKQFRDNISYYKNRSLLYNEQSCRYEFIDPLLAILGWDVSNNQGLSPQYREVVAENFSSDTDRPDYTIACNGVPKFFVEAKKPSVDISKDKQTAYQTRRYGWNAKHKIAVLTNFEFLVIYDTRYIPKKTDDCTVSRYKIYNYSEYLEKIDEISLLLSKKSIFEGKSDKYIENSFSQIKSIQTLPVDALFLDQINKWRVEIGNDLYSKGGKYHLIEVLNEDVQEFINQIVFLRICEDKNLPLYHNLKDTIKNESILISEIKKLFKKADKRYNSGLFSRDVTINNLSTNVIKKIIEDLYYPNSLYLFNIIQPHILGKIYELFLTKQLVLLENNTIGLEVKKDYKNKSIVTTPIEIVKYMVERSLSKVCKGKTPEEILDIKVADIACGSGIFLEEVFSYLQDYCVHWYIEHNQRTHLIEKGINFYQLPLSEKKKILVSCIFGVDIDIHAVEVAKFSLLIKLIENENAPSVVGEVPILPNLDNNLQFGNSLISKEDLSKEELLNNTLYIEIAPFDWENINSNNKFDVIIGNPPYVNTEGMHISLTKEEFEIYKSKFQTSYKQFDKYYLFMEQAINKIKSNGCVCFIVPNKFFKIGSGKNIRKLISEEHLLVSLDDFGDSQLFEDKTTYSSIVVLSNCKNKYFSYKQINSVRELTLKNNTLNTVSIDSSLLKESPWRLTTNGELLNLLAKIEKISAPIKEYVDIFNGIQTSAEKPIPIYWFSSDEIVSNDKNYVAVIKNGSKYNIEKSILRPYFKPTKLSEKGLNSYSILKTDKLIIFPYNEDGTLIDINSMKQLFPGTFNYLLDNYDRLVPKSLDSKGIRDVPNATAKTWYQYGRSQGLTSFINTPKLIVGILSKEPMYIMDLENILISSGGTAGYCAIKKKKNCQYSLEYIQAWLSHPITEQIVRLYGSTFEGGFVSRGTATLSSLPFIELDFNDKIQKKIHDDIVTKSRYIYKLNFELTQNLSKKDRFFRLQKKESLIQELHELITKIYNNNI